MAISDSPHTLSLDYVHPLCLSDECKTSLKCFHLSDVSKRGLLIKELTFGSWGTSFIQNELMLPGVGLRIYVHK